jgi:four helix bundle protein
MTNAGQPKLAQSAQKAFDLDERSALFGEQVILFARSLKPDAVTSPLTTQLVRAATSIGANYAEADDCESRKDFLHKIALCRKEAREVKHWLRMLAAAEPTRKQEIRPLWQEAKELNLIFGAIRRKAKENQ